MPWSLFRPLAATALHTLVPSRYEVSGQSQCDWHIDRLAYASASPLSRSCEAAQNKHQKDNASQSDIIPALQGGLAIYIMFFEFGCVNGTTPQVDSETERSCRRTRCFLIRAPASILRCSGHRFVLRWLGRSARSTAFTLVEVVIAVGFVAFVLTAILGLAAMAANETKNADLKARLAWITESVTSEYQSQRFSAVLGSVAKDQSTGTIRGCRSPVLRTPISVVTCQM